MVKYPLWVRVARVRFPAKPLFAEIIYKEGELYERAEDGEEEEKCGTRKISDTK